MGIPAFALSNLQLNLEQDALQGIEKGNIPMASRTFAALQAVPRWQVFG